MYAFFTHVTTTGKTFNKALYAATQARTRITCDIIHVLKVYNERKKILQFCHRTLHVLKENFAKATDIKFLVL